MKKRFRKRKLTCKGMSLLEVIISMLVLTIMATLMVVIATNSMSFIRNSTRVNNKVTKEAPVSELKQITTNRLVDDNHRVSVTIAGKTVNVKGSLYSTDDAIDADDNANTNADIDLQFVDFDITLKNGTGVWEEPTTEAPT